MDKKIKVVIISKLTGRIFIILKEITVWTNILTNSIRHNISDFILFRKVIIQIKTK